MKVDRRDFIKLAAGGALGTMLTPIPWQLIDESAKFSDTWAPEPPKGPSSFINSTCRLCPGGCGITVRAVEDKSGNPEWRAFHHEDFVSRPLPAVPLRAVKINGNPNSPVNRGGICALGASGLQLLYGSNRITTPLRRKNGKNESEPVWEKISWDEALNGIAAKLRQIRESGSPQTVACVMDSKRGLVPELMERFFAAYGSPNVITMPSQDDLEAAALLQMNGTRGPLAYDLENSKFVLSFGAGLLEGWGAPVYNMAVFSKWQETGEHVLVQVEPNCSITASKANVWLAPKPGTEAALALGIANVIIRDGLYSGAAAGCPGFGEYRALVESQFGLDRVSEITGVPKQKIAAVARQFAATKPAVAVYGRGQGNMAGTLAEFVSIYGLNALVGSLGQPGGVFLQKDIPFSAWPALVTDAIAQTGLAAARIDGAGAGGKPVISRAHALAGAIKNTGLNALFVYEANPCYALPTAQKFEEAVTKVPFVVAMSCCMNETAKKADIVLPLSSYLERLEDTPTPARVPFVAMGLTNPVLKNFPDARHPGDIMLSLASCLGGTVAASLPWSSFEAVLKDKVSGIFASRRGRVGDQDVAALASADDFWTALTSGNCWHEMSPGGGPGSPSLNLARYEPAGWMAKTREHSMVLVAYETVSIANRRSIDTLPYMTKNIDDTTLRKNDLFVKVNPETAGDKGFVEGSVAAVQTPSGSLAVRVHLDDGMMPGVIAIPLGLGHKNGDEFLTGKGVNAYQILEPVEDPATGLAVWWGARAELSKVRG
ncbi:MAG: molybdopterin-dependent oxidoreductase [Pseudomonadota bacterium]